MYSRTKISHEVELLRNPQPLDNYCISYIRECYIYCINGLFGSGYKFDSLVNLIRVAKLNVHHLLYHLYNRNGFLLYSTQNHQFKILPIAFFTEYFIYTV